MRLTVFTFTGNISHTAGQTYTESDQKVDRQRGCKKITGREKKVENH
jgi:hypothetical protein